MGIKETAGNILERLKGILRLAVGSGVGDHRVKDDLVIFTVISPNSA